MQLKLEELDASITNVNLRREKHGDDRVVAVDLSIVLEVSPEVLDQLAMNGDEAFEKILYSENGNLKQSTLDQLAFSSEFEKHIVVINNSLDEKHAKEFDDAKLCKFKATPKNGHIIDLSFQIQLHPSDDQVHWLTDGYAREIWTLEIKGSKQMDLNLVENGEEDQEPAAA